MSRFNTCRKSHFVRKIHPASDILTSRFFLRKQFSADIGAAHFPADGTAIDACAAAIFTFFYVIEFDCMNKLAAKIGNN